MANAEKPENKIIKIEKPQIKIQPSESSPALKELEGELERMAKIGHPELLENFKHELNVAERLRDPKQRTVEINKITQKYKDLLRGREVF